MMSFNKRIAIILISIFLVNIFPFAVVKEKKQLPRRPIMKYKLNLLQLLLWKQKPVRYYLKKNMNEKRFPASVTKIMTLLLIYEAIENGKISWDDIVTVSEHAGDMGRFTSIFRAK